MVRWGIIITLSLLLAGCYSPGISDSTSPDISASTPEISDSTTGETFFRSDECHLEVMLPPGWAAAGPKEVVPRVSGWVAFNSWGQAGFWAGMLRNSYGPETTMEQIPNGGAYVQLVEIVGPARLGLIEGDYPCGGHERDDLGGLWERKDWRVGETIQGVTGIGFDKWGRSFNLGVYCDQDASDATVEVVNALLESWRFDSVVPGDIGWAVVEALHLLPSVIEPMKFPISIWTRPPITKVVEEHESIARIAQAEVDGDTVVVTFMYRWDDPERNWSTECPSDRCHWWKIEARPSGEVVLTEEGGAALPGGTNE